MTMFESLLLLALAGIVVWVIVAQGCTIKSRRATFINLATELKPADKRGKQQS